MTNNQNEAVHVLLAGMPVKGLPLSTINKVVELLKEVKEKDIQWHETREKIFNSYDIVIGRPDSDKKYFEHPQYNEIFKLIGELDDTKVEYTIEPFLSADEFYKCINNYEGLKVGGMAILKEILLKTD